MLDFPITDFANSSEKRAEKFMQIRVIRLHSLALATYGLIPAIFHRLFGHS
jgi:hypothetical protein